MPVQTDFTHATSAVIIDYEGSTGVMKYAKNQICNVIIDYEGSTGAMK
jgi:hypothetical protein